MTKIQYDWPEKTDGCKDVSGSSEPAIGKKMFL